MNTKAENKYNDLVQFFKVTTSWHKARIKCTVSIICAMCRLQTVSFVKLAQEFDGLATYESNHRRIQRFFAEFIIDHHLLAKIIFSLLPQAPPYRLSLDRTNWKFGKTDINILMLSVCYRSVAIPLIWKMLPKAGNSNAQERKDILNEIFHLFGISTLSGFMVDKEFVGEEWFEELTRNKVPFYIRIRDNMKVQVVGKGVKKAFWLFNHLKIGQFKHHEGLVYLGSNLVYLSGCKTFNPSNNKTEFVIIASFNKQNQALISYKERWQIETMFRAMKSSGFNLENTHLTDLSRLSKLLALVAIAFVWSYLAGIDKHENIKPIKVKKHGRMAYSFFKYGLIRIAHALFKTMNNKELENCIKVLSCT